MKAKETLNYYNQNADTYIKQTKNLRTDDLCDRFVYELPFHLGIPNHVLDVGCGSGRDAFWISNRYAINVTAIDGSSEMIKINKKNYELSEVKWLNVLFDEIKIQGWEDKFTGIWACASLLHVPFKALPYLMTDLIKTLKFEGIMYASFKHGVAERYDGERFFCDMNEERLLEVLNQLRVDCTIEYDWWITSDLREDRDDEWFNVMMTKKV
ncbi:class I SAM-dependent methyltransferase [uncultured Psychrobacter sp.]|uniref:class I SAM-dependent methyltransferase n=1 Tax=uncultured Psychrobacter sp. TaxID=259303 RepID=UPI002608D692|nr:class I SAM-dependent methyltransferase [uncultured Psychrobacter sp.]